MLQEIKETESKYIGHMLHYFIKVEIMKIFYNFRRYRIPLWDNSAQIQLLLECFTLWNIEYDSVCTNDMYDISSSLG